MTQVEYVARMIEMGCFDYAGLGTNRAEAERALESAVRADSAEDRTAVPDTPMTTGAAEYTTRTAAELAPDIEASLNAMGAEGWRLTTFDGERYIFQRPRSSELHER